MFSSATRLLIVLIVAANAAASMTTTAATGRVLVGNAPAADVLVTLSSAALQLERSTTTSADGSWWLGALPPGTYDVTFSKPGHTSLTRRITVQLARVARADARLERSEDEESVTSTASIITVAGTTAATTHVSRAALERMPVASTPEGAASLFARTPATAVSIEDVRLPTPLPIGEEVTDQVTILRAGMGADVDAGTAPLIVARARSGTDALALTLRGTLSNRGGPVHLVEGAASGRVVRDRLWFFGAGWRGDDAWRGIEDAEGSAASLRWQPGTAHRVDAHWIDVDATRLLGARYNALLGTRTNVEAVAGRVSSPHRSDDVLAMRVSHVSGAHVVSAGASEQREIRAFFVDDRWSRGRWIVNGGLRHEREADADRTMPRIAVAYDLQGDGRRGLFASWGEYADAPEQRAARIAALGFATAIGRSGAARVDAIRRETRTDDHLELRAEAAYRLFDRFEAGGRYSYADGNATAIGGSRAHAATAWAGAELAVGDHLAGISVVQRVNGDANETITRTDVALRYLLPTSRAAVTVGSDVTNLFGAAPARAGSPRAVRFWIRLRR